ncbi:DNA methyltransferase [Vibrio phage vB_VpS_PG28]|nr:DNA methyltransferase [Vibrio phage vB_VpS_PG28]
MYKPTITWAAAKARNPVIAQPVVKPEDRGLTGSRDIILSTGKVLEQFPVGKFDVVYLDPPWQYGDTLECGNRGAKHKYDTMSMQELLEMPVPDLLHRDSIVAMWITTPFMQDAMLLASLWGLEEITRGFLWVKRNKTNNLPFKGLGHWTRGNPEDCYFFRPKGSKFKPQDVPDELIQDRLREHSRKPDVARKRLEWISGNAQPHRIELFSRENREGWEAWGNQVGKFDKEPEAV